MELAFGQAKIQKARPVSLTYTPRFAGQAKDKAYGRGRLLDVCLECGERGSNSPAFDRRNNCLMLGIALQQRLVS